MSKSKLTYLLTDLKDSLITFVGLHV